jgi:hypothetical protein
MLQRESKRRKSEKGKNMNTVQRIAKNTGVLLVSQIASYVLGFFFIMYTARYLGAAGFGINPFKKRLRKMLRNKL